MSEHVVGTKQMVGGMTVTGWERDELHAHAQVCMRVGPAAYMGRCAEAEA